MLLVLRLMAKSKPVNMLVTFVDATIAKFAKSSHFQVNVMIKESPVKVFVDTGAVISVIPLSMATKLGLLLSKTKMCIKPYGSKTMKCVSYYMGAVMHNDTIANVGIYVVDKEVETLLSGPACEALGITSFHGENAVPPPNAHRITRNKSVQHVLAKHPTVFKGVGKLKNYQVKLHIDDSC